jgi:hypothetical protein
MKKSGNFRHGYFGSPTYKSWSEMKYRCGNNNRPLYKNLSYCDRWEIFENFLEDMGERPKGTSIDRIDGTKGYSPENCRWASRNVQSENRKSTHYFSYKGKSLMLKDWAKLIGVKRSTLAQRIYVYKWKIEMALQKGGEVL